MSEDHATYILNKIKYEEWGSHAEAGRIEDAIVAYIRAYDWVTFAELSRKFAPHVDDLGDSHIVLGFDSNIILWQFKSRQLADAVNRQLDEKKIFLHPAHLLTYLADGGMMTLPLARKRPAKGRYKSPHWLPVCLRLAPYTGKAKRAVREK